MTGRERETVSPGGPLSPPMIIHFDLLGLAFCLSSCHGPCLPLCLAPGTLCRGHFPVALCPWESDGGLGVEVAVGASGSRALGQLALRGRGAARAMRPGLCAGQQVCLTRCKACAGGEGRERGGRALAPVNTWKAFDSVSELLSQPVCPKHYSLANRV